MFYDLELDSRSYREIEEDAVFHIPREYPEWTNYNLADPGMTLVQLLSWLTEVQQYHLSQPSEGKRRKYLKLLGVEVRHALPSLGAVSLETGWEQAGRQFSLLQGTRFLAEDMVFETTKKEWIHSARLIGAYMTEGESLRSYHNIGNDFDKQMRLYPFGEEPEIGNQCYFILDQALVGTQTMEIYFDICTEYGTVRNPADESFIPLAALKWEYYCTEGWEELEVVSDQTYAFLQSGKLRFRMAKEMVEEEQLHAYQMRVTLLENDFDVAPFIRNIYLNEVDVVQQRSLCDYEEYKVDFSACEEEFSLCSSLYLSEVGWAEAFLEDEDGWRLLEEIRREITEDGSIKIWFPKPAWAKGVLRCMLAVCEREMQEERVVGYGDAFANQEFELHIPHILYDSFEILVYDRECGRYLNYYKVEDFDVCSAENPGYILDVENERLMFGDCERGLAPNGEIRIVCMKTSLGNAGNIKADKIRQCEPYPGLLVRQYQETAGGRNEESVFECFERFHRSWREVHRGVTYSDYEELVKKTPGLLIVDSRVIPPTEWESMGNPPPQNQISIVVQPLSFPGQHASLSEKYRQNIERILEKRKMIGTRIQLLDPAYIAVSLYAEIMIESQVSDAKGQVEEAVGEYLNEKTWQIGKPVLCSTLYGLLDTLPFVRQVKGLSLSARGNGGRHLVNGDVGLPPNGIAFLEDLDLRIYTAD